MCNGWNFKSFGLLAVSICALMLTACSKEEVVEVQVPEVEVQNVKKANVPVELEWLATIEGNTNATIRAQVEGYLIKQNYEEGGFVKKGDVLFEIDPRPFEAKLAEAKSNLLQAEAALTTATADVERYRPLVAQNAVSKRDLDNALGRQLSGQGQVEAAKAAIKTAELNLEFTKIVAPIDGLAGTARAQIGDLVGGGAIKELTTISSIDPIRVYVPITEQQYLRAQKVALEKEKKALAEGKEVDEEEKLPLHLILSGDHEYPLPGYFVFAERQIDSSTGTLKVAALFDNPKSVLRPGLSARVRTSFVLDENAMTLPKNVITEVQGLARVYVVDDNNVVQIKTIKKGRELGDDQVIESGLLDTDKVIVSNTSMLKVGMTVKVKAASEAPAEKKAETEGTAETK